MADRFQLRPYQVESVEKAKCQNTIVCLPTGLGKTLIAARLIEHYLKQYPHLKIGFLVPTRPLVEQQSEYCTKHCRNAHGNQVIVQRLVGEEQASWDERMWKDAISKCNVMLGTASIFQKAFVTDKYMKLSQFSLLVFDECHNAIGNSPMAAVMRDGVIPFVSRNGGLSYTSLPRILGLTASFVNGSLKNMEKKRKDLEALMTSTIFCPDIKSRLNDESFHSVEWIPDQFDTERKKNAIATHLDITSKNLEPLQIKDMQKVDSRSAHVFFELGSASLFHYVEVVICSQIMAKATSLEQMHDTQESVRYGRRMRSSVPFLQAEMDKLSSRMRRDHEIASAPSKTNKLERLLLLLQEIMEHSTESHRGIVFVEQVALVSAMAKQINEHFRKSAAANTNRRPPQCGAVAGTGYQTQAERQEQLEAFSDGKVRILVATAALEEGIDVSDCAFVIRYSSIATTKAHIQGSGRARHRDAKIYYFENSPERERAKESAMFSTARDATLSLTSIDMQKEIASMNATVLAGKVHPYPLSSNALTSSALSMAHDDGIVNVFNCKQIFNQYCSITLGKSVSPKKELYIFRQEPRDPRKILTQVKYPTPAGWLAMTDDDFKRFWAGVDMEKVFVSERVSKKTQSEKEEMAFVYVVVVELREKGWLGIHNKPGKKFMFDIKRNCSVSPDSMNSITLRDKVVQSAWF
ncbi:hypothetical protein ACA910_021424 [Epithemia clementina (nom. ined.)]